MKLLIKTWTCPSCGYKQDFEPTHENMHNHFNADPEFRIFDMREGQCPSCRLKGLVSIMVRETNDSKKICVTVKDIHEIDDELEHIKQRSGTKEKLANDPDISTKQKEEAYRNKRIDNIRAALEKINRHHID